MPFKLIWETPSQVLCQFRGCVDFNDVNKATDAFYHDERSDRVTTVLWDFTEMSDFVVGEHEASELAATDAAASRYMKPLKSAFITQNPEFSRLVEHYIEEMSHFGSPWANRCFTTLSDARLWVAAES